MPCRVTDVTFGAVIALQGCALNTTVLAQGDMLRLTLTWRALAAIERRYTVFVQWIDANGRLALQRDREPMGGLALTSAWATGDVSVDRHGMIAHVPPGVYTLIAGLYDADTGERLTLADGADHVVLAALTVE